MVETQGLLRVTHKEFRLLMNDPRVHDAHENSFMIGVYSLIDSADLTLSTLLDHLNAVENDYCIVENRVHYAKRASILYDLLSEVPLSKVPLYMSEEHPYIKAVVAWRLKINK